MVVRLDINSAVLTPDVGGDNPGVSLTSGKATFTTRQISGTGSVELVGTPGESCAGWRLGFIQLQLVETNRAYYRGDRVSDGGLLYEGDRPPAWPSRMCRDTVRGSPLFYTLPGEGNDFDSLFPPNAVIESDGRKALSAQFSDSPLQEYSLSAPNTSFAPAKTNWLYSAHIGFAFCSVLTAQAPGVNGQLYFLKHFYWNCQWDVHFVRSGSTVRLGTPSPMSLNFQTPARSGVPNDDRFTESDLRNLQLPICNDLVTAAGPGNLRRSMTWI
jgi:hypothetical protein